MDRFQIIMLDHIHELRINFQFTRATKKPKEVVTRNVRRMEKKPSVVVMKDTK